MWRWTFLILLSLLILVALPASASAQEDWPIPNGHFFTQTGGGGGLGYEVTDDGGITFWSEFRRLGGVPAVGYPASQRFEWDGFTVQVFQRAIFQWRPDSNTVAFVNVFDRLDQLGKNDWLMAVRQTPPPRQWDEARVPWEQIVRQRLAVLDSHPAIRAAYFNVVGDPVRANGLPTTDVVDMGNHFALRAQRVVFQQWKEDVPWARTGQVTVALGGDITKEVGILPNPQALQPIAGGEQAVASHIVDVTWLRERLGDPNLRVVAFMPPSDYALGHIPGAIQIDWPDVNLADSSPEAIERWQSESARLLGSLGISREDTVVIYDDGSLWAPRLWWVLHHLGHDDKRILNGGLAAWQQAGLQVVAERPAMTETTYQIAPRDGSLTTQNGVVARLGQPGVVLVDARSTGEFQAGHIPGAVNVAFTHHGAGATPNYWRSPKELRELYRGAGVTSEKTVIAYCAAGVRCAGTYFSLYMLGYRTISLYSPSWVEWNSNQNLPKNVGPGG